MNYTDKLKEFKLAGNIVIFFNYTEFEKNAMRETI